LAQPVLHVDPDQPRPDRLERVRDVLLDGGVVALPTETFYGLAVDAMNPRAVARINRLKGKPVDAPVLLLAADRDQAMQLAVAPPPVFERLAASFWPGPLTLVVRAAASLPREIGGGRGTVGLRVPGLALPRALASALGRPLSGVSANRHGAPPCRTAAEVLRALPAGLDLLLDGGPTPGGAPSTVVDLTVSPPRILRPGSVPASALLPWLGPGS